MGELKYPSGKAGQGRHTVRSATWRVRRAAGDEGHLRQPVCVTTLDLAVERYGLPSAVHLRLGASSSAASVLAGASRVLASSTLKTVFCTLSIEDSEALASRLSPLNWVMTQRAPLSGGRAHVLLSRETAGASPMRGQRP
jgi:hypothetical protein